MGEIIPREKKRDTCVGLYVIVILAIVCIVILIFLLDNEFTQLMKGLQGERLRQAFKYLDKDQDGFIRPEEFKRIILVRYPVGLESYRFC